MTEKMAAHFGEWVRERRGVIGLSLRAFAIATGMDPGNLSKYERGVLPAPQDQDVLRKFAAALKLRAGSEELEQFRDLAATSAGRIPPDLANDPALLAKMPLLFRTARKKLTRDELLRLAERLKEV